MCWQHCTTCWSRAVPAHVAAGSGRGLLAASASGARRRRLPTCPTKAQARSADRHRERPGGRRIPTGKPRGTAITPDGRLAYVSDQPNNRVVLVDLAARKVAGEVPLGESPEGVGISPDGRWVVVAIEESNDVVFVDTQTKAVGFVVKVSGKNPEHGCSRPTASRFVSAGRARRST
jgi:YVTN family beta-propeller protein